MHRSIGFVALFVLLPAQALAAEEPAPATTTAEIAPRQIDAKFDVRTSVLLQYGGIGVSGDYGLMRLGPGTLAVGGSIAYEACASTCWGAPHDFTQRQTWVEGRATYHLQAPHIGYLDLYPMVTVGAVFAGATIHVGDASEYRATSLAATVGFGGGASYFITRRIFVNGEVSLRYAGASYDYELARGPATPFDANGVDRWSGTTIALAIGAGARF
jgi:hypothetical protein